MEAFPEKNYKGRNWYEICLIFWLLAWETLVSFTLQVGSQEAGVLIFLGQKSWLSGKVIFYQKIISAEKSTAALPWSNMGPDHLNYG